jgi:hypothetical protein
VRFYVLLAEGGVQSAIAVPLSLLVPLALGAVLLDVVRDRMGRRGRVPPGGPLDTRVLR